MGATVGIDGTGPLFTALPNGKAGRELATGDMAAGGERWGWGDLTDGKKGLTGRNRGGAAGSSAGGRGGASMWDDGSGGGAESGAVTGGSSVISDGRGGAGGTGAAPSGVEGRPVGSVERKAVSKIEAAPRGGASFSAGSKAVAKAGPCLPSPVIAGLDRVNCPGAGMAEPCCPCAAFRHRVWQYMQW